MTTTAKIFLFGLMWAAITGWATAQAQTPASDPASDPAKAVQVANSGKRPIVALYTAPPGSHDWSDDMLGKGTLKPGKTMKLTLKAKPAECKIDVSALLDNGNTMTRSNVDLCAPAPNVGF
jgi:P pilus assembly chaperone PapD